MSKLEQIHEALCNCCWAYDSGDMAAYANSFAGEGVFETPAGAVVGRDAIRAFATTSRARRSDAGQQTRHVVTNLHITRDDESEVATRSYLSLYATRSDGASVLDVLATYEDQWVLVDGHWKLKMRRMIVDTGKKSESKA
jgi:hypothetical protein